jgi:hypothetical protein
MLFAIILNLSGFMLHAINYLLFSL